MNDAKFECSPSNDLRSGSRFRRQTGGGMHPGNENGAARPHDLPKPHVASVLGMIPAECFAQSGEQ
jgi:hypothetical protein